MRNDDAVQTSRQTVLLVDDDAGISGLVLLIDLWFKWYGVKVSGGESTGRRAVNELPNCWRKSVLGSMLMRKPAS